MENRERILTCALDLFYSKGYDAVGIQEICQAAGVAKPTMYHYFGSKYGLLETLLREGFADLINALEQIMLNQNRVEESLYKLLSMLMDYASANYKAYRLLMSLYYSPRENETYQAVKPYIGQIHNRTVRIFEVASHTLGNMHGRQQQFATGFLGLINHYILFLGDEHSLETGIKVSEETKRSLLHQFLHGIYS